MKSCSLSFRQNLPNKLYQKFLPNEIGLIGSQKENNKLHFFQKRSLESMISLIKNTQLEYLSLLNDKRQNCINKKEKEKSVKLTKNLLVSLKNNLNMINKEKLNILNSAKSQKIKNENSFYNNQNNKDIKKDIDQLKDMNFIFENEIEKNENLIKSKNNYMYIINSYDCFLELYEEHICQPIKNREEIEDIFIKENIKSKNNLSITQTKLLNTERKIDELKTKINSLKLIIEKNKKIEYNNNDTIKEDTKEYISSSNNENNTQSKSQHNKKVNFTIDGKNNNSKIRNNCLCAKGCNYFNKLKLNKNNKIYNGSKIILMNKKKQKKRSSCPEIRIFQSMFGKKNNKLNNGKNYVYINKSINASDFDRTTKSTINDKTIDSENIFNKTL
jgi:hypothetical protein